MKTIIIVCSLLTACAFGQTTLNGPLTIVPPKGGSPTFVLNLVPAAPNFPCVAAPAGYYAICGQNSAITVDFGDGKGFVSLKGDKGDTGAQGPQGIPGQAVVGPAGPQGLIGQAGPQGPIGLTGAQGIQGIAGPPGIVVGKKLVGNMACAWGGHGVPNFNVPNCTFTITAIQ